MNAHFQEDEQTKFNELLKSLSFQFLHSVQLVRNLIPELQRREIGLNNGEYRIDDKKRSFGITWEVGRGGGGVVKGRLGII